jgi:hypothetical protein
MSDACSILSATSQTEALRKRIGWPCQAVRALAAVYAVWTLYVIVTFWLDTVLVEQVYSQLTRQDVSGSADWQRLGGLTVTLLIWGLVAAACYSVWQLFSAFLAGRIFMRESTLWLRRVGVFGLAAQVADMLARPLLSALMSLHLPPGSRAVAMTFNPPDMLNLLFLGGFIALGHVFSTASDIAEDSAHIV